jgi:hypothetical protein
MNIDQYRKEGGFRIPPRSEFNVFVNTQSMVVVTQRDDEDSGEIVAMPVKAARLIAAMILELCDSIEAGDWDSCEEEEVES